MQYELHPLSTLFPRLIGAEFENLASDIASNGLREPIVLHDGMILDGGTERRHALRLGVEPRYVSSLAATSLPFVVGEPASAPPFARTGGCHRGERAGLGEGADGRNPQWCNVAPLATVADRSAQSEQASAHRRARTRWQRPILHWQNRWLYGDVTLPAAIAKVEGKPKANRKPKPSC